MRVTVCVPLAVVVCDCVCAGLCMRVLVCGVGVFRCVRAMFGVCVCVIEIVCVCGCPCECMFACVCGCVVVCERV